jgi:SAM-dependent methyltransferase
MASAEGGSSFRASGTGGRNAPATPAATEASRAVRLRLRLCVTDAYRGSVEADDDERFAERYRDSGAAAALTAEFEALGSDYQANGYTTVSEADDLGRVLGLGPGQRLADLGAGCGWPGLYLARRHGCSVISLDPVVEGLAVAGKRAERDGQQERAWVVQAHADALGLRPGSVDAVVHTDVLC